MSEARRVVAAVRLFLAATAVLGTAALLFFLTFRERPYRPTRPPLPIRDALLDLAVGEGGGIWAVGHAGRIVRSTDGGETWEFPASPVTTPLAGVAFRDERTGLAVGYGGVILRTTDGGASWSRAVSGVEVYLTTVRFLADGRALAAGEWGTILESADAGGSWRRVTSGESDFIVNDLAVAPEGFGWAVGELGQALHTADGGRTWTHRRLLEEETTLFSVDVVDASDVWVAGGDALLLHSTDGGASWRRDAAPCAPTQLLRIRFAGERGYVVGRRCAAVTDDGGASWRFSRLGEGVRYSWLYGLHVTAEAAWAAGYGEALFRAGADDSSWRRLTIERGEDGRSHRGRVAAIDAPGQGRVMRKGGQDGPTSG